MKYPLFYRRLLPAFACLLISVGAPRAVAASGELFSPRYIFTADDRFVYELRADGAGAAETTFPGTDPGDGPNVRLPMRVEMFMSLDLDVLRTYKGGSAELETRINRYVLNMSDSQVIDFERERPDTRNTGVDRDELELMRRPVRLKLDQFGTADDVSGVEELSALLQPMDLSQLFTLMQPQFPDHPVRIGDSWTRSIPAPGVDGASKVLTVSFRLTGQEEVKGLDCMVIESEFSGDFTHLMRRMLEHTSDSGALVDQMTLDYRGTSYFSQEAGIVAAVSFEMNQRAKVRFITEGTGDPQMDILLDLDMEGLYELR